MEITDEEHARFKEIERVLSGVVQISDKGASFIDAGGAAKKALEPVYKPLVPLAWHGVDQSTLQNIGADYLEAAADRLEGGVYEVIPTLREWAKAERAIGS